MHWIVMYQVDIVIHLLNNPGLYSLLQPFVTDLKRFKTSALPSRFILPSV